MLWFSARDRGLCWNSRAFALADVLSLGNDVLSPGNDVLSPGNEEGVVPAMSAHLPRGSKLPRENERPPEPMSTADYVLMGAGFSITLLLSAVLGHGRIFWEDEMLGWMLLTDPSWHHMVAAWRLGADGGGFAFYLLGRAWLHAFGPSEAAFRLFSATGFGLGFVLTYATLRRFYVRWIVVVAMFNTYFCSQPLVLHMVEGRFYGLLVFALALTVWLAVRLRDYKGRLTPFFFVAVLFAHALLVTSHILGVTYSFFVLAAMFALDRQAHRWRPGLYATVAVTWLLLVPEREAIRASAQVGKPWFWTTQPTPVHLLGPVTGYSAEIVLVMFVLTIGIGLTLRRGVRGWKQRWIDGWNTRRSVYVFIASFLLLALTYLIEGYFGPVLFVSRYLMPLVILTAFLTAEMLQWIDFRCVLPQWILSSAEAQRRARWAGSAMLAAVVLLWDSTHIPPLLIMQPNYTDQLTAMLPKGVPVLLEDGLTFTEVIGRQHNSGVDYLFPLDWEQSVSPYAPRLEVTQYNLMNNWRKAGYFSGSIVNLKDFLATTPTFLVVDGVTYAKGKPVLPEIGNPLALRFAKTRGYTVKAYAAMRRDSLVRTAWLVTHDPRTTGVPAPRGPLDTR
jgi:hypothetical protein